MLPKTKFFDRAFLNANSIYNYGDVKDNTPSGRIFSKMLIALKWAVRNVHTLFSKYRIEMPYFEVMVTEKCNMRCKKCSNLMPLIASPKDVPIGQLIDDIDRVLASVDQIILLKVLGGEPFLYRALPQLLNHIANNPKIMRIEVVTNGTVYPREDVVFALIHPKIHVVVSPYGKEKTDDILKMFDLMSIKYFYPELANWNDFGDFERRRRMLGANQKIFAGCEKCITLINGEIFCCPRAGHATALGLVPKMEGEYITVRDNFPDSIKKRLYRFSKLKVISTCDYCTNPGPIIPIAEQMES